MPATVTKTDSQRIAGLGLGQLFEAEKLVRQGRVSQVEELLNRGSGTDQALSVAHHHRSPCGPSALKRKRDVGTVSLVIDGQFPEIGERLANRRSALGGDQKKQETSASGTA